MHLDDYLQQQREIIEQCVRVCHDEGSICWEVGNYVDNGEIIPLDILLYPIFDSFNLHLRNELSGIMVMVSTPQRGSRVGMK